MPSIFISHSSLDKEWAETIKAELARLGLERVFLDFDKTTGIGAGEHWEKRLYEEVARCHAVIMITTANWLASKWCFAELVQARALGKIVIPILCEPLEKRVIPEIQAIEVHQWNDEGRKRLEQRLRAISDELARGFSFEPTRSPYPGINSFESEDAAIFFGRDNETRDLIERLDACRAQGRQQLLLLVGASGSGKSSLLKAGVLPQIARRKKEWILLPPIRPEKTPLEALAKAIALHIGEPLAWKNWQDTLCGDRAVHKVAELFGNLRSGDSRSATVMLAIDQLEELYTVAPPEQRTLFVQLLASALDPAKDLPFMVLASARSDVLAGVVEGGELAHVATTFLLEPMPLDRVVRLVEGPASVAGLNVERGLAEQIAHDVENPEALPLLAHALSLLYRRGEREKRLMLDQYRALGDAESNLNPIQNSIRMTADRALSGLNPTPAEYDALREAFVPHLVRVTLERNRRVRQPAYQSELPPDSLRLIRALVDARLLTTRQTERRGDGALQSEAVIEVTHEALFNAWPLLDKWLTLEHAFLVDIERIRGAYEIWSQAHEQQKPAALLHGLLLSRARDWLEKCPKRFAGREMKPLGEFIGSSVQADEADRTRAAEQTARTERIKRLMFRGAIGAATIFLGIAIFAAFQYRVAETEREIAVAREIFAMSKLEEGVNDECGLVLSLAAFDAAKQARGVDLLPFENEVRSTLSRTHVLAAYQATSRQVSWSLNGAQLAFVDGGGKLRLWRADAPTDPPRLWKNVAASSTEWLPDGGHLAVVSDHGLDLFDAQSGALVKAIGLESLGLTAVRFDHAGKRALAWSLEERQVVLINLERGSIQLFPRRSNVWRGYAWSPDDKQVAVASERVIWFVDLEGKTSTPIEQPDTVVSVAWSPDGRYLAVGYDSGRVLIWDTSTKKPVQTLQGHENQVTSVDFSPDGGMLASASWDHSIGIWDTRSWSLKEKLTGHNGGVVMVRWDSSGTRIATTAQDGTVRIWSPTTNRSSELLFQTTGWVWKVDLNHDGTMMAIATDNEVVIRNKGRTTYRISGAEGQYQGGGWSSSNSSYAVIDNNNVTVYDAISGRVVMTKRVQPAASHYWPLFAVAISPKGDMVAVGSPESVHVYSVPSGETKWDIDVGSPSVAFSPDGRLLALVPVSGTAVEILDVVAGKRTTSLKGLEKGKATWALQWSPDGQYLAAGSDDHATRVWKIASPEKPTTVFRGHLGEVKGVAWNATGSQLATASLDKTVRLWDVSTGRALGTLTGHVSGVRSVAWSADGKSVITGAEDGTSRLFSTDFVQTLDNARKQTDVGLTVTERQLCGNGDGERKSVARVESRLSQR